MTGPERLLLIAFVACLTCTSLLAFTSTGLTRGINVFAAGVSAAGLVVLWRTRRGR